MCGPLGGVSSCVGGCSSVWINFKKWVDPDTLCVLVIRNE